MHVQTFSFHSTYRTHNLINQSFNFQTFPKPPSFLTFLDDLDWRQNMHLTAGEWVEHGLGSFSSSGSGSSSFSADAGVSEGVPVDPCSAAAVFLACSSC